MPRLLFALLALAAVGCGGAPPNPKTAPPPIEGNGGDAEDAPPPGAVDEDSPPPAVEPTDPGPGDDEDAPDRISRNSPPAARTAASRWAALRGTRHLGKHGKCVRQMLCTPHLAQQAPRSARDGVLLPLTCERG